MDVVRLTFVAHGHVPVHASAFVHRSTGVLVAGWAEGGKTELLLALANHGAEYVGDEWAVLSPAGRSMFGVPVAVAIRDWHSALRRTRWRRALLTRRLGIAVARLRQQLMVRRVTGGDLR